MNNKVSKDFYIYIDIDDFIFDKKHKLKYILERIRYLSDDKKLELEVGTVLVLYVKYNSLVKKFSIIDDVFVVKKFIDYYNTHYKSKKETNPIRSFLTFKKPIFVEDITIIKIKDYCTCKVEYTRNIFVSLMKYFSKDIVFYSTVSLLHIEKIINLYKIGLRNISCGEKDYTGDKIEKNSIQLSLNDKYYVDEELSDKVYFILQTLKKTERENTDLSVSIGKEVMDEIIYKMYGESKQINGELYIKNISGKNIELSFEKGCDNSLHFTFITLPDPYYRDGKDKIMDKIPLIHKSILNDEIDGCFIFSYKKVYFISLSIDFLYTFYFMELLVEDLKEKTFQYLDYTISLLREEDGIDILKNTTILDLVEFLEFDRKTLSLIDLLKCENTKIVNIQEYDILPKNNTYIFYFSKYGKYNCTEKYLQNKNIIIKPFIHLENIVDRIGKYLSSVNKF